MQALDATLERAMLDILSTRGIRWRATADAPSTLEAATASLHENDEVIVDIANSDQTIWSSPQANYVFRAWHDWHHVNLQAEFNDEGERRVHRAMVNDLQDWFFFYKGKPLYQSMPRSIATLEAENIGQILRWKSFGAPPVDQRTFAEGYLAAKGLL